MRIVCAPFIESLILGGRLVVKLSRQVFANISDHEGLFPDVFAHDEAGGATV